MTTPPIHLLCDLVDQAAERHPTRPALRDTDRTVTYAELAAATHHVTRQLRQEGVGRGDRVVVTASDTHGIGIAVTLYACARLGAAFSILHEQVRGEPLAHVLRDCTPRLLVSDDPDVKETAEKFEIGFLSIESLTLTALDDGTLDSRDVAVPVSTDPVSLIYTSGTTSLPKAVVSTHQQVLFAASAIQNCLNYREDDIVFCPLPLSFDYGLYQLYLAALSGACIYLATAAEAGPPLLRRLAESEATILPAVPSVSDRLTWLLRRSGDTQLRLRLLTNTGAALAEATVAALRELLPAIRIQLMYGLTECKRTAIMPPDGDLERPGACGLPLPGTEVLVIGEDGERLETGQVGQFVVRGPHVMAGYWQRPDLSRERFPRRDGLFPELHTGDYGWMDDAGFLYFAGRRDDIYKERGFRISTTEIEAAARKLPGISAAAVLPPAEHRNAVLVVSGDIAAYDVRDRLSEHIEPFKIPRRVLRVTDMPVNGNGKTDRKGLAALVDAAGHSGDSVRP